MVAVPGGSSQIGMTYNYSATQNNGRIMSSSDAITGENVSYTYDSLNRLIAAASTGVQWSETYSYDGFGNMTGKTSTKGTQANPQVDSTTNRARMIGDYGFDANGNWLGVPGPLTNLVNTWNVENQLVSTGTVDGNGNPLTYTYDPWGKRVLQYSVDNNGGPSGTLYFYSIAGQRLGTYRISYVSPSYPPQLQSAPMYFGGRLLAPVDRLGSVRRNQNGPIAYFPWGEEEKPTTPDGTDKYATYFRDGTTNGAGQDYANARYYNNSFGRFWTPDPAGARVANPKNPTSWNRYAYAGADPVNFFDPSGRSCTGADPSYLCLQDDWYMYHLAVQETSGRGGGSALSSLCYLDGDPVSCAFAGNLQQAGAALTPQQWEQWWYATTDSDALAAARQALANAQTADQIRAAFSDYLTGLNVSQDFIDNALKALSENDLADLVGGHFNLTASLSELQNALPPEVAAYLTSVASQGAVGYPGDNGERWDWGDVTLHFTANSDGTVTFHIDLYDPRSGITDLLGHLFVDFFGGHIPGMCLDAACH